jgi:hypothetical protein
MALATTSRVNFRSALEATYGATAASTARRKVRITGESLQFNQTFDKSKEIRSDRQIAEQILLGASGQGGFQAEMLYNEYDAFMESALLSTFLAFGVKGVSPSLTTPTFAANTLTQTGGTSFATIAKGQWVQIQGCTGTYLPNNGVFQSSLSVAATATVLTFEGTPFSQTGAATGTVTISTSRLTNGTAFRTHNLEVEFNDIAQFLTVVGVGFNKLSFGATANQVATLQFDTVSAKALAMTATSNLNGTDDVNFPTTYSPINATSNVAKLYEAGAVIPNTFVKSLSFDLENGLAAQMAIGSLAPVGCRPGTLNVTGKMSVYLADGSIYNKFVNNVPSSLAIVLCDGPVGTGNGYVITLPSLRYTDANAVAGGIDQDMMVELTFAAKIDVLTGKMIIVDRFGAAAN